MTVSPRRSHLSLILALVLLLASAYLVTYTGRMELGDQLEYYDAAGTFARFGQPLQDEAMWQTLPAAFTPGEVPLRPTIAEPLFIQAAAPVYFAAERLPGLGLVHTVWLFNIALVPLVAVLVYLLALKTGVPDWAALLSALAFGLLTIWWTYSQTFFREPLMTALLLLAALMLWNVPRAASTRRRLTALVLGIAALVLAFFTKEVTVFALPGLALLLVPPGWWARWGVRRLALAGIGAAVALCLLLIYTPLLDWLPGDYFLAPQFPIESETTRIALHTYLLSIGGSVWGTSPVLLLAIPGAIMLWRKQPGLVIALLAVTFGFLLGYGLLRGEGEFGGNWFGGTIWPQRFLLPVIPFLAALTAPVWPAVRRSRWMLAAVVLLCIYSLWWQVSSVAFNWSAYDTAVFDASFGLTYWLPGFNAVQYIRPVGLLRAVGTEPLNWAWARADILPYALVFGIPFGISAAVLLNLLRRGPSRRHAMLLVASAALILIFAYIGLRLIYDRDPLYMAERDDLHQSAALIRERVPRGGVVLVNDPDTTWFWLNYGKVGRRWVVGLPYHPGDRGSFEQPVEVESEDASEEIAPGIRPVLRRLAAQQPRLWLFMDSSSDLPWARRPFERYMGERYYRIDDVYISPHARLLSYDTTQAPAWDAPAVPEVAAPFTFTDPDTGQSVRLLGYTLPDGPTLTPGGTLAVSLVWEADAAPTRDYTAALFLVREDDPFVRVQGQDSWLGATFKTTTLLPPGVPVWDHRALLIPADWPPGAYRLWVKLYHNDYAARQITDLIPDGSETTEGNLAILPRALELSVHTH